jgi:hypothetical protein
MRLLMSIAVLVAAPAVATAQVPEVDPGGRTPPPAYQPAPQPQAPVVIPVPAPQGEAAEPTGLEDMGRYHLDDADPYNDDDQDQGVRQFYGATPELHVVRKGDTLWDICFLYFNDPWQWPRIWSYNPSITNPHWIYPGDIVRLLEKGAVQDRVTAPIADPEIDVTPTPARTYAVTVRQLAFVDKDEISEITIDGSPEEKQLLATGDPVYLAYPEGKPPKEGETYAIYAEQNKVKHPGNKEYVGSYVRILGDLQVQSVQEGKRARGVITDANDVIERGSLVGPVQRTFRNVEPTPNQRNLRGTIVAQLAAEQLIGQGEVVFIDLGTEHGVERGNRLFVIRRGDAYAVEMGPAGNVGQDDPEFPARAIGEIVIVQTGESISVGLVTLALQEMGRGDHVLMRKSN